MYAIAGAISAMAVFALGFCVIPGWPTLKSNNKATDELWAKPKINNRAKIQPKNSPLVEEALRIMREAREEALRKSVDDS